MHRRKIAAPNSRSGFLEVPSHLTLLLSAPVFAFIIACSGGSSSGEAQINELTITVNSTDYSINFSGNTGQVSLPMSEDVPAQVSISGVELSAGASGLTAGATLRLTDGRVKVTITAEDGMATSSLIWPNN